MWPHGTITMMSKSSSSRKASPKDPVWCWHGRRSGQIDKIKGAKIYVRWEDGIVDAISLTQWQAHFDWDGRIWVM